MHFEDQLRRTVRESGMYAQSVAHGAGLSTSSVTRFLHGGTMTLANAERVAEVIGFQLTMKKINKKVRV